MIFYITIIFWVFLDLFTKYISKIYLIWWKEIPILWDLFSLKYAENTGISFSVQIPYLNIVRIIFIISILWYYYIEEKNKKNKFIDLAFWLILAWAIWNGYETIFNWFVIDFLSIKYLFIFNLADVFISIWAIIYLLIILKNVNFTKKR